MASLTALEVMMRSTFTNKAGCPTQDPSAPYHPHTLLIIVHDIHVNFAVTGIALTVLHAPALLL